MSFHTFMWERILSEFIRIILKITVYSTESEVTEANSCFFSDLSTGAYGTAYQQRLFGLSPSPSSGRAKAKLVLSCLILKNSHHIMFPLLPPVRDNFILSG
jgi:hypothetical protein